MVRAMRRTIPWTLLAALLACAACVAKPEATRSGGTACRRTEDCNSGVLCGEIALCVQGFCAEDTVFRACSDGGYPDARGTDECVTYISCNTATCGPLVACVEGRCDESAPPVVVPCDAGTD
jgi:hypothetical protein